MGRVLTRIHDGVTRGTTDGLSPASLARLARFSPHHFSRVFSALTGETLTQFIRRMRLEKAAAELRDGDDQIVRIAMRNGFHAHESFTRAFRTHFGLSPSEYRALRHTPAFPPSPSDIAYGDPASIARWLDAAKRADVAGPFRVAIRRGTDRCVAAHRFETDGRTLVEGISWTRAWARGRGLWKPEVEIIGTWLDDDAEAAVNGSLYRIGVTLDGDTAPAEAVGDGLDLIQIPGGRCAIATVRGGFGMTHDAYAWIYGSWLPASGHRTAETPPFEIYRHDLVSDDGEATTVIHVPLADEPET